MATIKKKFDIRLWVLVTSYQPITAYVFTKCYLRICGKEYDLGDFKDNYAHLTNYSINKKHYKNQ